MFPKAQLGTEAADVANLGFQAFFGDGDSNPEYFSSNKEAAGPWCVLWGCAHWGEERGCGAVLWVCLRPPGAVGETVVEKGWRR